MMIEVGAELLLPLNPKHDSGYYRARVVYIHPQNRYFTAEFSFGEKKVRECYCRFGKKAAWAPDGRAA